ncbi:glycosyl hydrolase family 18 protein [Alicyclobacillus herbarius]|uniref:glycosyl hydrolase family 18 protein n=1 Tax=Alicyclobacillus herbarius TaxID=122960 RepID=UPI00047C3108|nr:glycosyl hydrolase family 18 protein [Alicyclobacillus herbarius]
MTTRFMTWVGSNVPTSSRGWSEVSQYANKFQRIGLFEWAVTDTTGHIRNAGGTISGSATSQEMSLIQQFPQIQWYISIQALGSYLQALWTNQNGAQNTFMSDLATLLEQNPWWAGVDIDFEQGGDSSYTDQAVAFFQRIYNYVHSQGKLVHADLPGLTGPGQSLGGEYWCDYAQLAPYFDTCTIMTYGYSWLGSAPGAISPASWVQAVYDYAVTVIPPAKIFLGVAGYGIRWQIYEDPGSGYRGTSGSYYAWLAWMLGVFNHTGNGPPQPLIPWAAFWDDDVKSAYMLLDIYDYQEPEDATKLNAPYVKGTYNSKPFMTAYSKTQGTTFTGLVTQQSKSQTTKHGGALSDGGSYYTARVPQTGEVPGYAQYTFNVPTAGTYAIVLHVNFPWWSMAKVGVYLDGTLDTSTGQVTGGQALTVEQPTQWYPLARTDHWIQAGTVQLSAGTHTLTFSGLLSAYGAQFWGFAVASGFNFSMSGGSGQFTLVPQTYKDVNGNAAQPASGYVLTLEVLRHDPEYATVWSDDWRTYPGGHDSLGNWYNLTGSWSVSGTYGSPSTLKGSGQLTLGYDQFDDLCVWADFSFSGSEAGIVMGSNKIGLTSDGRVVFNGSTLGNVDTSGTNELRVRCRGGIYDVWLNGKHVGQASGSGSKTFGLYTANGATMQCMSLNAGDAYWMMPREAVTVTTPTGSHTLGRISRSGVTWDDTWGYFEVPDGTEERSTRSGTNTSISLDWDYLHSASISLGDIIPVTVEGVDAGVWVSRLYLCDQDGASIAYYADINSFRYWFEQARDTWDLAGVAMWALGLEDPKIFGCIPDQW